MLKGNVKDNALLSLVQLNVITGISIFISLKHVEIINVIMQKSLLYVKENGIL